ncbi:MAG: Type 1 glutamine amidotransferase-like domain-containing protein [Clostridiales Family XIII bacterium]|jgi:dipeptidase E|nr:Type 1 glutamine amidotransferase-like domain-containing protein [Clostridiales Family XIII bacterium]
MKTLFLCSFFKDVARLFPAFAEGELAGKTITFIPTASVPERIKFYVKSGKKALRKLGLIVEVLELTTAPANVISATLRKNDFIYIAGGNTFFLLQELRRTGADKLVAEQIEAGKLYIGESAGAVVLSPIIDYAKLYDDCAKAPDLTDYTGLGIVDFYPCPHHTNFPFKRAVEKVVERYDAERSLKLISNSQAIMVRGAAITRA